jgi:hypothetical protein
MWNNSNSNDGTVSREEAVAYIETKANEQGIGQGFKVYYNGNEVHDETDLPERCILSDIRVSASLNQASRDTWCSINGVLLSPADLAV